MVSKYLIFIFTTNLQKPLHLTISYMHLGFTPFNEAIKLVCYFITSTFFYQLKNLKYKNFVIIQTMMLILFTPKTICQVNFKKLAKCPVQMKITTENI